MDWEVWELSGETGNMEQLCWMVIYLVYLSLAVTWKAATILNKLAILNEVEKQKVTDVTWLRLTALKKY